MISDTGTAHGRFGPDWEFEFFDPARWQPRAVARRCWNWMSATRRRRWSVSALVVFVVMVVLPVVLGAVAAAQTGEGDAEGSSVNSGLSWMHVRDSSGAELASYLFATNHGGLLHPGNTAISLVISLEFAGWIVIVTTAIWLIGYALSFEWLNLFSRALNGVAHSLSGQIATPMMLAVAVTIGAFFVAWFTVRGFHAKATMQVVSMLLIAVMGPIYLAEPLADVLSSDGLLAQGRDIGISVAAGLNGNSRPDAAAMVPHMQSDLADNFARRPLQVWNFGRVVDTDPACKSVWTSAVMSGSDKRMKDGLENCDRAAFNATREPTVGQIGAGLILLLAGTVLLLFAVYLALKIIKAALDTIYHGLMSIFGFAAGGFVYGPTQTFLVRNVVDGFIAGARMACYTIFLGVYVLFLGNLFKEAQNDVMSIFVVGAIVEIIAIFQLQRLSNGLSSGNEWVANRFALAMQGVSRGGGGGGSGTALGMGQAGAKHKLGGAAMLATLAGFSTVSNSPLTEWMWGRTRSPLRPFSRTERQAQLAQWGVWGRENFGGADGLYTQSYMNRHQYSFAARQAAEAAGGIDTVMGASAAIQGIFDYGGGLDHAWGAMIGAGFTDEQIMSNAIRSWGIVAQNAEDETLTDKHLGHVVSAISRAQHSANRVLRGEGSVEEAAADLATLQAATFRFRRANPGGVTLDGGAAHGQERAFVERYMAAPSQEQIEQLQLVAGGGTSTLPALAGINETSADRMLMWIGNEHARVVSTAVDRLVGDPGDPHNIREVRRVISHAADTDLWASRVHRTPWNAPQPPGTNPPNPNWRRQMGRVGRQMR
ncbi:hypothetical protein [Nocardia sp. BSTN01]|uniref:hypothetical protein n=1 Tax=Nocardia sp. BSTN01 TaxID=2783665 RepID=UPI001E326D7F|nr:hypothetical protein [Nocardia sp. BSTN01]